jgi:exodeoxyribonuclease V alpha subunit
MNGLLQEQLNPADQRFRAGAFQIAVGDKIMQIKNDYSKDVFNGDIGFVARVESGRKGAVYIDFDGREVQYEWMGLENTSLAYAVTVHKSQGSEYPAVVIPLTMQHYPMLQRNLLYTAVSRGKSLVVLVGDPRALETAIRNNRIRARYTGLIGRLQKAMRGGNG